MSMKIFYPASGGGWVHRSAAEMLQRGQEVWLYSSYRNSTNIPNYKRAWLFHVIHQPFCRISGGLAEISYYKLMPLWKAWLRRQRLPACDVVHAVMAHATEAFDCADEIGALKVLDASNSHPTSFYGFWQRELDVWAPGTVVNLPRKAFARANREIERADMIVCASTYVRDSMRYNGVPEEKLTVNPFGVDLNVFKARERVPEKPRFLFVGLLTLRKGLQYLVPAFERLKREIPGAELIVCGALYPDFQKFFAQWRHLFTYQAFMPHAELSQLMRSCTAFVFPSIEEGFARVIGEAMACGLPVIATHNSGASTVVENDKEGIIVPPRSADSVYDAMLRLAQRPDVCERMGKAAVARITAEGSWSHYGDRLLESYQTGLQRREERKTRAASNRTDRNPCHPSSVI